MTNPAGTQWETALLTKLTSNGERIALMEQDIQSIKSDVKEIKEAVTSNDRRLTQRVAQIVASRRRLAGISPRAEEILKTVKIILILTRWIAGAVVAIALSLVANFVYSLIA